MRLTMILTFKLKLKIKNGLLPVLINELYKADCEVTMLSTSNEENNFVSCEITLNNSDDVKFLKLISLLKSSGDKFREVIYENMLENYINNGLLKIKPSFEIATDNDYSIKLMGIYNYIQMPDVIMNKKPRNEKNAGMISSLKKNERNIDMYDINISKQIDSIVMNLFTGINAFPLTVNYDVIDDFIKVLKSIEDGFSAIRFHTVSDGNDPDFYSQVYDELLIPVLSRTYDELPVIILSSILKILKLNKLKFDDCNIGFIGINSGVMRLTSNLKKLGALRVLGYDDDEKTMMYFEKTGGLATTCENILSNSDIVILVKECKIESLYASIRPGLLIISILKNSKLNDEIAALKSCRHFHRGEINDHGIIFPGLLQAMIENNITKMSDEIMVETASIISKYNYETEKSIDTYRKVHEQIWLLFK